MIVNGTLSFIAWYIACWRGGVVQIRDSVMSADNNSKVYCGDADFMISQSGGSG